MGENTEVVGHAAQRSMLERLVRTKKLPSTMLFAGASGIGKRRVALELARSLYCTKEPLLYGGCGECKQCKLFEVGNLPDCVKLDCMDRETFDVERLRGLLHTLSMRTFSGGARVIIFDNAEALSTQAANLLLKSFEEPRLGNHFILICSNPGTLPQTLLSRCQIWFFDSLRESELREVLSAQGFEASELEDLVKLADGSLANVATFKEHLSEWRELVQSLRSIGSGDTPRGFALAAELSKDKEALRAKLTLLRIAARTVLLETSSEADSFRWSSCILNLLSAERLIFDRNIGANYVLSLLFARLADHRTCTRSLRGDRLLDRVAV